MLVRFLNLCAKTKTARFFLRSVFLKLEIIWGNLRLHRLPTADSRLPRNRILASICVHCAVCQNSQCVLICSLKFSRPSRNKKIAIPFKIKNTFQFFLPSCSLLYLFVYSRNFFVSCCRNVVNLK